MTLAPCVGNSAARIFPRVREWASCARAFVNDVKILHESQGMPCTSPVWPCVPRSSFISGLDGCCRATKSIHYRPGPYESIQGLIRIPFGVCSRTLPESLQIRRTSAKVSGLVSPQMRWRNCQQRDCARFARIQITQEPQHNIVRGPRKA
jgi:hypothetical protein